ncbi:putative siderophore transport system permease protein YfiZ precursor [Agrobacterium rosae]|uniref:Putative siderophore transport system permease protein YfiZ n=1 Tax=Agrobacterium rosae TaxID=1972867 RepID=A0A1R3U1M3_9HYPH|nr:putative siderophore transport system permease protein YfiZ precursor [Agrobacterium rosae]
MTHVWNTETSRKEVVWLWLPACLALLLFLGLAHLSVGARPVSPQFLIDALTARDHTSFEQQILLKLRLPRLLAAILCGASLGIAGRLVQSILRNPLAEPHILGLNAGASLAIVATTALPAGLMMFPVSRPLIAAAGSGVLFALVLFLSSAGRTGLTMIKVTFCGIALSALASACVSALLILDQETLEQMRFWLAGDLSSISLSELQTVLPVTGVAVIATAMITSRLDIMSLGDKTAMGLGVPVRQTRMIGLVATGLFCGSAVSLCGPIGFIGLIVGGVAHRMVGGRHMISIPLSAMLGANLMLAADIAARTIAAPHDLATGVLTAFIGAPVFIAAVTRVLR